MLSAFSRLSLATQNRVIIAAILCLSLFMFYPVSFHVGHDLASYLAVAKNFIVGNGMIDIQGDVSNHRFGYKLLLAGALWLGQVCNNEMFFVIIMQTIFSALTATLCYVLAYKLFDRFTAVLAWGLLIFCPTILASLPEFGLDGVWPAFCLASLLLFLKAADAPFDNIKAYGVIALSAVFAGLAVWVKESTGVNFALIPLLLVFALGLDAKIKRIVVFYAVFIAVLYMGSVVVGYLGDALGQDSENERRSFQSALAYAAGAYNDNSFISGVLFVLDGWRGYFFAAPFSVNVHQFYPVFFMFYFAAIFGLWQMVKGLYRRSHIVLFSVICAYLPYAAWAAQWHMRNVQLVILFVVFSIVIAHFIVAVQRLLWREAAQEKRSNKAFAYKTLSVLMVLALLLTQYFSSTQNKFYFDDNQIINRISAVIRGEAAAKFDAADLELAAIVMHQIGEGQRTIITDSVVPASALSFFAPRQVQTRINLYQRIMIGVHENPYIPYYDKSAFSNNPVFACVMRNHKEKSKRHVEIMVFDDAYFLAQIDHSEALYILVNKGDDCTPYFTQWLDDYAQAYQLNYEALNMLPRMDYMLFKVSGGATKQNALVVRNNNGTYATKKSDALKGYLSYLRAHDSYSYRYYTESFPFLGGNAP
jgi:hypothetical protein